MYQSLLKENGFEIKDFYGVSFLTKRFHISDIPLFKTQYENDEPDMELPEYVTLELSLDGNIFQYCAECENDYFVTINPYVNKPVAKRMLKLFNLEEK